ncbi:DUF3617 domain-containing protein [Sphingobium sp. B2]|uniref:DUF3617 domain-containing protein n=1 Tax=Sphingobium sp. B2 TaxID=2583228 RepID=UPI00119E1A90|nr:DUF3617 domain-containing protein [Sphingobium sp. B2]
MRKTVLAGMPLAIMPLVTMLALGGCSEPAPAPEVEETPILMQAGEWVLTRKTTGYNTPTVTPEQYQAALKQTSEDKVCLSVDAEGLPDVAAMAGKDGTDCTYKDKMVRKGRMIATLACTAGKGTSEIALEGNYTADTLTLGETMTQSEGGGAVLRATYDLSGKRVGDCPKG